jgi:choline dehydrogenase-like flavoprotein
VSVTSEQAPNPASRVTLSARRDALGQPMARLDWRLSEADHRTWIDGLELLAKELADRRIGRISGPDGATRERAMERLRGGRHHMGTTRMSEASMQGVVDRNCQVHGVDNLFIAGSSVFATAGHANPTLTIVALALRLADHLKSACFTRAA